MNKIIKYILIFGLVGMIIGILYGLNYSPNCNVDPITGEIQACMGSPQIYAIDFGTIGLLIGVMTGLIIGKIRI